MANNIPLILIMAGGTGGHIFPALAVAKLLQQNQARVIWLGNPEKMEGRIVEENNIELYPLTFPPLRGKGVLSLLKLPYNLLISIYQAWQAFRSLKPQLVIGFGGYITFPGGVVAKLCRVPLIIHEANAIAGMSNKVLALLANRLLCGFPGTFTRAIVTGNPIRSEFNSLINPSQRYFERGKEALNVLVVGGSLGAQALNNIIPQGMAMIPDAERPNITHQSGKGQLEELTNNYRKHRVNATCLEFIDNIAAHYAKADVVICRSGALTISELAAAGVAAVLIPFPYAVDDHQTANAKYLVSAGGAFLMPQNQLSAESIARISRISRNQLQTMAEKSYKMARSDASQKVVDICWHLLREQGYTKD